MSQTRDEPAGHSEIAIRGRLVHDPGIRTLPSGDELVTLRVSIPRAGPTRSGRRTGADWVDCALWTARLRRAAVRWHADDWVEVRGDLRRRYVRAGGAGAAASVVEVEARTARRVRRADRSQS